jgi:hypothetical protein
MVVGEFRHPEVNLNHFKGAKKCLGILDGVEFQKLGLSGGR